MRKVTEKRKEMPVKNMIKIMIFSTASFCAQYVFQSFDRTRSGRNPSPQTRISLFGFVLYHTENHRFSTAGYEGKILLDLSNIPLPYL